MNDQPLPGPGAIPTVTLYSKPDCHLCDIVKARIAEVRKQIEFNLVTVDITTRPDLWERYRVRIPVVFVNGEEAFVYRLTEQQLLRRLRGGNSGL